MRFLPACQLLVRHAKLASFAFLLFSASALAETRWHQASEFTIEGKGWAETTGTFERLPARAEGKVTGSVWGLAKDSAGIAIRFVTDAPSLSVRWSLTKDSLAMPHMPATGVSGVDIYSKNEQGVWEFVANGRPHQQDGNFAESQFPGGAREGRECLVYLPLYNGTKSLEIGIPENSHIDAPKKNTAEQERPIVVYGTSIAQGGCASRPGLAWPAILGRLVDKNVVNLGFSGSGRMEPDTTAIISEIDASLFIIDCIWNIGDNEAAYQQNVPALVNSIRERHPDTPVLFVGQSHIRNEAHPTPATKFQEAIVQKLIDSGVENLYLTPGTDLVGHDTEGTVDGVHPNDIGMDKQAKELAPVVQKILIGPPKTAVYIDTDLAAEVDDPYALYRALIAPELNVVGVSAIGWEGPLPFPENTVTSHKMVMEMLDLLEVKDRISHPIGALHPMPAPNVPVDSEAARDIIAKAHAMPPGEKLQVFVLGCYTNIASALILDPSIEDKIAVLVMGYRFDNQIITPTESNTRGDLNAANYLLRCNVELKTMVNSTLRHFQWTKKEIDHEFKGKGGIRDYLVKRWETYSPNDVQRTVWDIAIFEAFINPDLATFRTVDHNGRPIQVWTAVDIPGMKSDYFHAAAVDAAEQDAKLKHGDVVNPSEHGSPALNQQPVEPPKPIVISRGPNAHSYQAFPDACRLQNSDILVAFYAGYNHVSIATDDFELGGRLCMVRSSDEGKSWSEPTILYDDADDNRDPHLMQLDDGTILCTFFSIRLKDAKRPATLKDSKIYDLAREESGVQVLSSKDNGVTWSESSVAIPNWLCSAPVRQLADGTCILGLYRGDKSGFSVAGTVRSLDRGITWESPVEIKAPQGVGLNAETDIIELKDGTLYAAMRSFTDDMYFATSDDQGKSWTDAKKAGIQAHAPHFTRLADGSILLSHRLPKTSLHVSRDECKTWVGPHLIDDCVGAYPATVELKDKSVLIVYYTEGGGSVIRAKRFRLDPAAPVFKAF